MIDVKGLGKPNTFDSSDHKKFPAWRFRFGNFVCGVFEEAERVFEWARAKEEAINADSAAHAGSPRLPPALRSL